jgi:hypothetical protein
MCTGTIFELLGIKKHVSRSIEMTKTLIRPNRQLPWQLPIVPAPHQGWYRLFPQPQRDLYRRTLVVYRTWPAPQAFRFHLAYLPEELPSSGLCISAVRFWLPPVSSPLCIFRRDVCPDLGFGGVLDNFLATCFLMITVIILHILRKGRLPTTQQ